SIEKISGIRASPVIQESALIPEFKSHVIVLGIDLARDIKLRDYKFSNKFVSDPLTLFFNPESIIITGIFADKHRLSLKSQFKINSHNGLKSVTVAGIIDDEGIAKTLSGDIIVMNIKTAQNFFGYNNRYSRIEVSVDEPKQNKIDELKMKLGTEYSISKPAQQMNSTFDYAIGGIHLMTLAATAITTLISIFIIYNSLSLSVVEKVKDIGILRAIGASRFTIISSFVIEGALIGFISSLVGMFFGISISKLMISQMAEHTNILIHLVNVSDTIIPQDIYWKSLLLGTSTSIIGSLVPSIYASGVSPMSAIRKFIYSSSIHNRFFQLFILGAGSFAISFIKLLDPSASLDAQIVGLVMSIVGLALALPQLVIWFSNVIRAIGRTILPFEGYIALDNIIKFPSRTSLTVIAFAGSLTILVAMWGMLGSMQKSLREWQESVLVFDLSILSHNISKNLYDTAVIPDSILNEIKEDSQIDKTYGIRTKFITIFGNNTAMLIAMDIKEFLDVREKCGFILDGINTDELLRNLKNGQVVISDNFANLYGSKIGDQLLLPIADGNKQFRICEQLLDYSWQNGVIIIDRDIYKKYWNDSYVTWIDIKTKNGADIEKMRFDLNQKLSNRYNIYVFDAKQVGEYALKLVKDAFKLADSYILVAIIIGAIGIANTLFISFITQARQFAVLRAVGATLKQVHKSLAFEAVYIGSLSGIFGCLMGIFAIALPMKAILMKSGGFDIPFSFPTKPVFASLAIALIISIISSFFPMRLANKSNITEDIQYE
ncbi:MAG: ABC transporter permease, partial [Planctomycetes bacterium]|nr:ABC transporter permease [Planctomycetota bacterium]